jgi:hypothetical protein
MASISLKYKSKSGNLTAPGDVDPGAMIPIATVYLSSAAAATISFTDIPQSYEHLQLRLFGRTTSGNGSDYIGITMNGATSGHTQHQLVGNGSAASSSSNGGLGSIPLQRFAGVGTSVMGGMIIDILDYANTNKYKTVRELGGYEGGSDGFVALVSGMITSTSATTSITLTPAAGNFIQYTHAALYGIKKAGA